jgi:HEAT repeat protein
MALKALGDRAPMDVLLAAIHDTDTEVRHYAWDALASCAPRVPLELLRERLYDPDRDIRDTVASALPAYGELYDEYLAADYIRLVLEEADASSRKFSFSHTAMAQAYARMPVDTVIAAVLTKRRWYYLRYPAGEGLGLMGERAPVDMLVSLTSHEDDEVRAAAIKGLAQLGGRAPIQVIVDLLEAAPQRRFNTQVAQAAAEALGALSQYAPVEPLVKALDHVDPAVGDAAARALGAFGSRMPIEALLEALSHSYGAVGHAVAQTLGKLGEQIPCDELVRAHAANRDRYVRLGIRNALLGAGTNATIEYLSDVYNNSATDSDTRQAAGIALVRAGYGATIVDQLVASVADPDANVRESAIDVLGLMGNLAPLDVFTDRLHDRSETYNVRMNAAFALVARGDQIPDDTLLMAMEYCNDPDMSGYALLTELASVRRPIPIGAASMALRSEVAPGYLTDDMCDEIAHEAAALVRGDELGHLPLWLGQEELAAGVEHLGYASPQALDHLIGLLNWPDWTIQAAAARALSTCQLDPAKATVARDRLLILQRSIDSDVRAAAIDALQALGNAAGDQE